MRKSFGIILLLYFLLGASTPLFAQSKSIVIKTGKLFLTKKKILVYKRRQGSEGKEYAIDYEISKVSLGRIYLRKYFEDTLVLVMKGYMPIIMEGLNKIKSDTIIFSGVPFTKYSPIDTMYFYDCTYYNDKNDSMHITDSHQRNTFPNNSTKHYIYKLEMKVNDAKCDILVYSDPYDEFSTFCNPGSYYGKRNIIGVKKYYILKL